MTPTLLCWCGQCPRCLKRAARADYYQRNAEAIKAKSAARDRGRRHLSVDVSDEELDRRAAESLFRMDWKS